MQTKPLVVSTQVTDLRVDRARLVASALVLALAGCAAGSDVPMPTLDADDDALSGVGMVPTSDIAKSNVAGVGDTTQLYRDVDDGIGFAAADDGTTYVKSAPGTRTATHLLGFSGGPAGVVTSVSVKIRAQRGTGSGSVQARLFDGSTVLGAGAVHPLPASWTDFSDTFSGLSVAAASRLRVRVVLVNDASSGSVQYTQLFLRVTTTSASDAGSAPVDGGSTIADSGSTGPAPVKAFPTAEGFGAVAVGGRGPAGTAASARAVYIVRNLTDPATRTASFDGSLRWAIEASGPRTIVFAVAGYIVVKRPLIIRNPYVTIAGQTAPGGGIALRSANRSTTGDPTYYHSTLQVETHDVILRHLRLRPGRLDPGPDGTTGSTSRSLSVVGGSYNVIADHVSASWGNDTNMMTGVAHDVTFQWCISSEGLNLAGHSGGGTHARAMNHSWSGETPEPRNFTDHHNLCSHVEYRVPQLSALNAEVIDSVVYHVTEQGMNVNSDSNPCCDPPLDSTARLIGNYFKRLEAYGDSSGRHREIQVSDPRGAVNLYVRGNYGPSRPTGTEPETMVVDLDDRALAQSTDPTCGGRFPLPRFPVTVELAARAYDRVVAQTGATRPVRDATDQRIVAQLVGNTVSVPGGPRGGLLDDPAQVAGPSTDANGYAILAPGTPAPDADADGIADAWERAHGLDATSAAEAQQLASNGYTNLENYVNELAGDPVP